MDRIEAYNLNNEKIELKIDDSGIISKKTILPQLGEEGIREFIVPGLVDLQVNGYGGYDFNNVDTLTPKVIVAATKKLWAQGVTSFLPTFITNSLEGVSALLSQFNKVNDDLVNSSIIGFHIEGPFISPLDGYRGAHSEKFVTDPNIEWVDKWQKISNNKIKLITFSPHWNNSLEFIKYCTEQNIKIAIGHTHASSDEIHNAIRAGASLATHFGNGCPSMIPRHQNNLWAQLANDNLWIDFIGDGFHLPKDLIKVILATKKNKCFMVSDTTSFGGMKPGKYKSFIGGDVVLENNGRLSSFADRKILAGSAQSLFEAVKFMISSKICSLVDAWNLSAHKPYQYLNDEHIDLLSKGFPANFCVLNLNGPNLIIREVYIKGKKVI